MASEATVRELLNTTETAYQAAKAAYEAMIASREAAIRTAHEDGLSVRVIADQLGVSFGLVGRIVRRDRQAA